MAQRGMRDDKVYCTYQHGREIVVGGGLILERGKALEVFHEQFHGSQQLLLCRKCSSHPQNQSIGVPSGGTSLDCLGWRGVSSWRVYGRLHFFPMQGVVSYLCQKRYDILSFYHSFSNLCKNLKLCRVTRLYGQRVRSTLARKNRVSLSRVALRKHKNGKKDETTFQKAVGLRSAETQITPSNSY